MTRRIHPLPRSGTLFLPLASLLVGAVLPDVAQAQDRREPQYRVLELTDGRALTAEILGTEATGLSLQTPQGKSLIGFELLVDMQPTDAATYQSQSDWVVYVAVDDALKAVTMDLMKAIPGVSAHPQGAAVNGLTADEANAAIACGQKLPCVTAATDRVGWMWVVSSTEVDGKTVLEGGINKGSTRTQITLDDTSRDALWSGLHQAIGLAPPTTPPPDAVASNSSKPSRNSGEFTPAKVTALSFVPLPGVPAMAQKDWTNTGLAWGIAVPSAALFVVGAAAAQEESNFANPGFLLSAAGGSYLSIVFANQVTGMRAYEKGKERSIGFAPMGVQGGGGAMVVVR